jgi:hypothetical protein
MTLLYVKHVQIEHSALTPIPGDLLQTAQGILRVNSTFAQGTSLPLGSRSIANARQYFADHYPDSLFSLTGSTSDEVPQSPSSSRRGQQAQQETSSSPSITVSPSSSAAAAFAHHQHTLQTNSDPIPPGDTPYIATPSTTYVPNLELDNNDNAKSAVDQLWPKLEALIEPFGLHRAKGKELKQQGVEGVRQEADDLRDPDEDVHKVKEARGSTKP